MQPRPLRRAPAPLAGDDHVMLADGLQKDRLEHAPFADRIGELVEGFLVELDTRLLGIGPDPRHIHLADAATRCHRFSRTGRRRRPGGLPQQRLQPHAEALGRPVGAHAATANWGRRPISSRASRTYATEPEHLRS